MRNLRLLGRTAILSVLVLSSLAALAGDGKIHRKREKVPNRYIVMLYKSQPAHLIGPGLENRHRGKLAGIMKELDMFSIDLANEAAAEAIAGDSRVAEVEEDGIIHVQDCFRQLDPSGSQWALAHLNDLTQVSTFSGPVGLSISQVRVYVIDSPIRPTWCVPSTDLMTPWGTSKVVETQNYVDSSTSPPGHIQAPGIGISSHGTAVASILVGNTYGVAPDVNVVSLVVVNEATGTASDNAILQAGNYAVATHTPGHPAVANVSLSAPDGDDALDSMLKQMVDHGIFVAAAAGNGNVDACQSSPGRVGASSRYPGLMAVGATDYYGSPTMYSNYGACVDVWAPGGDPYHKLATSVGSGWGTSFATPEVAGAAVLLLSKYPTSTPGDVWSQLKYLNSFMYGGVRTLTIATGCNINNCNTTVCPPPVGQ
jgi:subtilisin family serine protease